MGLAKPIRSTLRSAILSILLAACAEESLTPFEPETAVKFIRILPCGCFLTDLGTERTIGVLGTKVAFVAEALAADGTVLDRSSKNHAGFSWSSSAPEVATVEKTPLVRVTGVSEGTATITATSQGVTGSITVNVHNRARLAWSLPLPGKLVDSDITIGADGTIYVVTFGDGQGKWFAVSPHGALLWTLEAPQSFSTPAIGTDGTLYAGLTDGGLIAVGREGTIRWTLGNLDGIRSSPAIGPDGTIYVAGLSHVYAVDARGELKWAYEAKDRVFNSSSPAIASNGVIYVGGTDGRLHAINPDGSPRWTFDVGEDNIIHTSASIDVDGTIYFGALGGLYAVDPDGRGGGSLLDKRVQKSPSIGSDGTIYVSVGEEGTYAINPGGGVRWNSRPGSTRTPILGANGNVYLTGTGASGEPIVYALDREGRLQWDFAPTGPRFVDRASPAIGIDGAILAVSMDPVVLYGIIENGGGSGGYAGAPWPQAGGNRANTGRVGP